MGVTSEADETRMPTYLARRGATYQFRRIVPKELQPIVGKSHFTWSLKTTNLAEAKRLRNRDAVATDAIIEAAREATQADPHIERKAWPTDLDDAAIQMKAAKIAVILRRSLQTAAEEGGGKLETKRREFADTLRMHEDNLSSGWLIDQIPLSQSEANAMAFQAVLSPQSAKPLPAVTSAGSKTDSGDGETLMDVLHLWSSEGATPRTVSMWRHTAASFAEFNGDKPVRDVTKREINAFLGHLSKSGAKYETLKNRLNQLKSLFGFAARRDLIPADPTAGLKAPGRPSDEKPREPWSVDALNSLFNSPIYTGAAQPEGAKGAAGYFLPLLGLFTGARLNELGQLRPEDVSEETYTDEAGERRSAWIIRIVSDQKAGLRLKTKSSARRFPVHPELERLGFIKLVLKAKASGQSRIFDDLTADTYGNVTSAWGKWFGRYIRDECEIQNKKITFHSLRHSFKDTCRALNLKEDVHDAITGHANGSEARRYGYKGYPIHPMVLLMNAYVIYDVVMPQPYTVH